MCFFKGEDIAVDLGTATVLVYVNKEGIVLLLDLDIEFETLCQMIVQKLWESRNFLGDHTSLIVNSGKVMLDAGQKLALKVLLQSLGHEVKYFLPEETAESVSKQKQQP